MPTYGNCDRCYHAVGPVGAKCMSCRKPGASYFAMYYNQRMLDAEYLAQVLNIPTEPVEVPDTDRTTNWSRPPESMVNKEALFYAVACRFDSQDEKRALKARIEDQLNWR